jgi:MFS family permease
LRGVSTPNHIQPPPTTARLLAVVFMPFAGGYFLSYFYRSINAVIAPDLIAELDLAAADLGLLTAAYFFAFAAFQLPLGILLDRFGPRRVQAGLLLVAACGAFLFSVGEDRVTLIAARALIGLGVCGGLMSSLQAFVQWFPRERWPLVNGVFMTFGGLGALAATEPLEWAVQAANWRFVFVAMGALTIAAALCIYLVVPERAAPAPAEPGAPAPLGGFGSIFRDPFFWRLAPVGMMCMASGMALQGLWAGPWLRDVALLPRAEVARHLMVLTIFLTLGFPLCGALADLLVRRGVALARIYQGVVIAYLLSLIVLTSQVGAASYWPWALFGLMSNGTIFAYPMLSQHFPANVSGRANTALNLLVFGMAFALQYGVGIVIDLWPPLPSGGYDPAAYRVAIGIISALVAAGLLWFSRAPSAR